MGINGGGGGGEKPCDGLVSRPGGSSDTPGHASCYRNRYKLQPFGPLAHLAFTLPLLQRVSFL